MNQFYGQIVMLFALFAIMYFMLIRPQQKKDKEVKQMRDSLKVGDQILTIGGIYGKIVRIKEDRVTIQVGADRTKLEIAKWAVNNVEKASADKYAKDETEDKKVTPKSMKKLSEKKEEPTEPLEVQEVAPAEENADA